MKAKIKLTIKGKVYQPGEKIADKLSPSDERFLLREGYIGEDAEKETEKKSASDSKADTSGKKSAEGNEAGASEEPSAKKSGGGKKGA